MPSMRPRHLPGENRAIHDQTLAALRASGCFFSMMNVWLPRKLSRTLLRIMPGLMLSTATCLSAADVAQLAGQLCAACHGEGFTGGRVPAIRGGQWRRAQNDAGALQIITQGLPGTEMVGFGGSLSLADRTALVEYIRSPLPAEGKANPKASTPTEDWVHTELHDFKVELIAGGFEIPWSLVFLPDGRILVSERAGHLRLIDQGKVSAPVRDVPRVRYVQDGGLLSIALDPEYATNRWIYLSYADSGKIRETAMTKIVRGRIANGAWTDQQVVWQADQRHYRHSDEHYGCRLLFHDGKLFFSVGDRGDRDRAQDLASPFGKIHRVNPDGSIPSDNPFTGKAGACPSIWTYGHRNPQGFAIDPRDGELWATEHGPMGGDELNHILPGRNYGWPVVTFGREHTGAKISDFTSKAGMENPVVQWTPSIATCPILFTTSDRYPRWQKQLLVGSLSFQELRRVVLEGGRVISQEVLFSRRGRIRDIKTGPDGYLYLAMEKAGPTGEIIRLVPREQ